MSGLYRHAPRRERRRLENRVGDPVVWNGSVWLLLGRTATGSWWLLPVESWGTATAREAIVRTTDKPVPLAPNIVLIGRARRDRRGTWTRRDQ